MKTVIKTFILTLVLSSVTWIVPKTAAGQVSVSFQIFYDDLSPYGSWVDNDDYGYVWIPDVYDGFTPYATNGHWIYTYDGWTWVSNYSWGWAPFHYGRWTYDPYYGWLWIPDNEWGPGWVSWRRSDDYYGWAPLGPGISIDISYQSGYNLPYNQWTFVRNRDFGRTNINNYYINNSNNVTIINNTTVINNTRVDNSRNVRYNSGPDRTEVERRAGKKFIPVTIKESNKPGQKLYNGELQIYRPRMEKNNTTGQKPAPSKVVILKDVKPVRERNTEIQPQKENPLIREQQRTDQKPNNPPVKEQQRTDRKPNNLPVKEQQQTDRKPNNPPVKEQQPTDRKPNNPPVKEQQPTQRKPNNPPVKEQQPTQRKPNNPPVKKQAKEKNNNNQPNTATAMTKIIFLNSDS